MIKVNHLGKNVTVIESSEGPVYLFEYKRTINNYGSWSTFSNNLEELIELNKKELEKYND